ncbi:MAG: T9SS type A sorting domain-containing protein [Ignavibacteriaceae bacterium]
MKKILLLTFIFALTGFIFGQSVLEVPAADDQGNPIINALTKYVVADTNEAGQQLHDVYKLQRGKTYFYNQSPVFKNPITLIADIPGNTNETKPPKLLLTKTDEGEVPYEHCITTFANLTVKNIAFSTITVEGDYSWANAILLQADGLRIQLENCHFEFIGWGMIEAAVDNTTFIIDKCYIRNGTVLPDGDEWVPFFIEVDVGTVDTLIIRNSTFFNLQGSVINIEFQSPVKYFKFDHNTLINVVKGFSTSINAHLNSNITNNIFYNVNAHGGLIEEIYTGDGDQILDGIISVDTLISNEPGAPDSLQFIMDEKDRQITLKNNVYFYSQGVKDYFAEFAATVEAPKFMDTRAQSMFDNDAEWPNFISENNVDADPGFTNFGGTDDLVAKLRDHRLNSVFGFWAWDPDVAEYPEFHWAFLQWPQPEDLSYSASFTSTDGYHVGSLQWYPDELAEYEEKLTDVAIDYSPRPAEFSLEQNYPNPFNPSTKVNFTINKTGEVNLRIFNALGQQVMTLINNQILSPGAYNLDVDMSGQTSGVYFLVLKQQSSIQVKKMTLLK